MKKLLAANWKENPRTEAQALALFKATAKAAAKRTGARRTVDVVICPPFIYLEEIAVAFRKLPAAAKKGFAFGAQDVFWEEQGAYTSEIGPKMLRSLGARYVIIGHSERRHYDKETDAMINQKIKAALQGGLKVILCVGEPLSIRRRGAAVARTYIKNQLKEDLRGIRGAAVRAKITIAYEPIWAIGTGRNDLPKDAAGVAKFIKKVAGAPVLYGGSANSKNIGDYVQYDEIGGALVGGASLKAGEFGKMIAVAGGRRK